jgi:hypothetical protein
MIPLVSRRLPPFHTLMHTISSAAGSHLPGTAVLLVDGAVAGGLRCDGRRGPSACRPSFAVGLYSRSGNSDRATRSRIERATPGRRSIQPDEWSFTIIWCTEGGLVPKYRWKSASAGATPFTFV